MFCLPVPALIACTMFCLCLPVPACACQDFDLTMEPVKVEDPRTPDQVGGADLAPTWR